MLAGKPTATGGLQFPLPWDEPDDANTPPIANSTPIPTTRSNTMDSTGSGSIYLAVPPAYGALSGYVRPSSRSSSLGSIPFETLPPPPPEPRINIHRPSFAGETVHDYPYSETESMQVDDFKLE